ncbi:dockerin type I repeat-containing protein [Methanocalculus chunghsingensis]|nr:dockerin type I repeat-containing protein [Methanocalculus chunghsingensis]
MNRITLLIISFCLALLPLCAGAVSVAISPDHIEEGDTITIAIDDLEDGSALTVELAIGIPITDQEFALSAREMTIPYTLTGAEIRLRAEPVTRAGLVVVEGGAEKSIIQNSQTGVVTILQRMESLQAGSIEELVISGITADGGEHLTLMLQIQGVKEGPDQAAISFALSGITAGTIDASITVDGDEVTSTRITVGQQHLRGDFNGNGRVDIGDVSRVAYMAVGLEPADLGVDFNGDSVVDSADAAMIAWYYVGKISSL